jgi:T-complex protein 1 subunit gamma
VVIDKREEKLSSQISQQPKRELHKLPLQAWKHVEGKTILTSNSVADIIRSCLGPKAMLKMLLDPMGGIVLTNDGHAILREIEVSHPAAKSMIELSRTQDEEVGDGTTTVIILGMKDISVGRASTDICSW